MIKRASNYYNNFNNIMICIRCVLIIEAKVKNNSEDLIIKNTIFQQFLLEFILLPLPLDYHI